MKRKMAAAVAIATVAMFILFVALPLLTAPATATTATNIQIVNNNNSKKTLQSLQWENWWNNDTGSFFTDFMRFNMSPDFMSGIFTPPALSNIRFGLAFAKLVEFNDTNGDGYYNFNDTLDEIIKEYNLLTDVDWTNFAININFTPVPPTLNSIQINITGKEKTDNNFTISFGVSLYLSHITVTFNNQTVSIPSKVALKFGLHILHYKWENESPSYLNASRYLALVTVLNGSVSGSIPHNFMLANGQLVIENGSGAVPTISGTNDTISEIYFVDSSGRIHAKFNWFNGAYNTTAETSLGPAHTYFHKTNNTMKLSLAFAHDDFEDGNLIIDPYFQLLQENPLLMLMILAGLTMAWTGQAFSTLLLYGGIAFAVILLIIIVAAVAVSKR